MTNSITKETRKESYDEVLKNLSERQMYCINSLKEIGASTASEVAKNLYEKRIVPMFNRNYSHPRLNELVSLGIVQVIGKRKDIQSNRNVAIYKLVEAS